MLDSCHEVGSEIIEFIKIISSQIAQYSLQAHIVIINTQIILNLVASELSHDIIGRLIIP